jgi:hypothetical protein
VEFARRTGAVLAGLAGVLGLTVLGAGCASRGPAAGGSPAPLFELTAEQAWQLNLPHGSPFGASGLLLTATGDLLALNDREPTPYRVALPAGGSSADLVRLTNVFDPVRLRRAAPTADGKYDCEGLARDAAGRLYMCEEANRWILRCDPATGQVERLPIDWAPVQRYFSSQKNASFEGVAVGEGRLYVANERSAPVIIVVDLESLKIVDHFVVSPQMTSLLGILHYSDLSWQRGRLFVLCRHHRVVLEVDPKSHAVVAEFSYRSLEDELAYDTEFPTGVMEGLAVDDEHIWLATDNNGLGRASAPHDTRPTLLKCRRPKGAEAPH